MTIPEMIAKATCFLIGHKFSKTIKVTPWLERCESSEHCIRCGTMGVPKFKPQKICSIDTCSTVGRLQVRNEDLKAMVEKTNQKIKRCDDYIAQSIGVFRQIEWTAMYHTGKSCFVDICPVCRNEKADGHKPGCQLERILAITPAEAMKRAVDIVDALKGARHLLKVYEEHGYIPIDGNQMFLAEAIQKVDSAIWRYGEAARSE